MADVKGKRARRVKVTRAAIRRQPAQRLLVFFATNDQYENVCKASVKSLPSSVRVGVHVAGITAQPAKSLPSASNSVVGVSRLTDLNDDVLERLKAAHVTKQVVFISKLPIEAMTARLMALKIRSSSRLHIAAKASMELEAEMIRRLVAGMTEGDEGQPIVDVWIEQDDLVLLSASFDRMSVPLAKLVRFLGESRDGFERFEIDEDGRFIYWPHADVHFGWKQLEQLIDPTKAIKDQEKSARFNLKYGKAIRELRESLGLKQTDIQGLTDRQLRRIEHGEQMASTKALESLAQAHGFEIGDYMSRLAQLASAS
jgi:hypothetical protein